MNRILIAAAGTGGHVFPALAVAERLRRYGWQVVWLGTTEQRLEARIVPAAGFTLEQIDMRGMRGHGVVRKLLAPWQLFRAFLQCRKLLRQHRSQLVLTFGGYVCGPAGLAARWCGIPLLVHEQNAVAGLTNKLLARVASHTMVGFAAARQQLHNAEVTGNPLREDWLSEIIDEPTTEQPFTVLVVGGSLGAQALNEAVPEAVGQLNNKAQLKIIHQCGTGRIADVEQAYQRACIEQVQVVEFIEAMHYAYQQADVVICRAGALTVSELAVVGTPAIFVPLPHAVDDHQTANARELVNAGAAYLLPQSELKSVKPLTRLLGELRSQPELRLQLRQNAAKAARPDATEAVVSQCERWANAEQSKAGDYDKK
ncbi:hypothetical protein IDSA_00410 [Pseudidiomarina salinarum]|uniref:UDP-N-acetylglucosamine--N-acetylmuramyl-(pentapeptide) pyrophosphoryl-undecaprenol N-acetylglucosamine transferase n=1 Tax=Pseudidiomarina salinarum TaxID=435908 RepID=A0A094IU74_9GAMM|nr:undecaprenyldiphospho-muramoylpentapeptide beta-N-acetylglucosaminyltransferase [Pseudidiomarina salinarum]KFZ31235.1 hypothetical protein IDSA_00410 [Pseudidiomarina salinarum]RUO71017.1 undecaprenyldiphospho-muramoylpentapeptide beta-N-acetylglucosaminyltransferase [Pseudidiomarina salinarum]